MASFEWSESLETGMEEIDNQHRGIIASLGKLEESIRLGKSNAMIGQILSELKKYAFEHFSSEEIIFDKYNFPDAAAHKELHRQFFDEVSKFEASFENDKLDALAVSGYLRLWISNHVMRKDMEYKVFFEGIGVIA